MKLSDYTLTVLKNFSKINGSILIREGNTLSTKNTASGAVFAFTEIPETFPHDCCIFELNSFLQAINLYGNDVDIEILDKFILIKSGKSTIKFYLANQAIAEDMKTLIPAKQPNLGDGTFKFSLTESTLSEIIKAAQIFGSDTLTLTGNTLKIHSLDGSTATGKNETEIEIEGEGDTNFSMQLSIDDITLIKSDYLVEVFPQKKCVRFTSTDNPSLTYYIMEKVGE